MNVNIRERVQRRRLVDFQGKIRLRLERMYLPLWANKSGGVKGNDAEVGAHVEQGITWSQYFFSKPHDLTIDAPGIIHVMTSGIRRVDP